MSSFNLYNIIYVHTILEWYLTNGRDGHIHVLGIVEDPDWDERRRIQIQGADTQPHLRRHDHQTLLSQVEVGRPLILQAFLKRPLRINTASYNKDCLWSNVSQAEKLRMSSNPKLNIKRINANKICQSLVFFLILILLIIS